MFSIQERYSQAIRSANLTCDVNTTFSDLDVIGAMAIADRRLAQDAYRPRVGSGAVSRLLGGGDGAGHEVVRILSARLLERAEQDELPLSDVQAVDIARACVAWVLHGACPDCDGHGFKLMQGTPALSERVCMTCGGTRKISFTKHFHVAYLDLAKWLVHEMARDLGLCGAEALRALAPKTGGVE